VLGETNRRLQFRRLKSIDGTDQTFNYEYFFLSRKRVFFNTTVETKIMFSVFN
jgi:hypothetical protein